MSKNFTALAALKLRDEGKLAFDVPAETVIPELKGLKYPTTDSPKITVRDLLTHSGGFVTDDPWGDRQLPMSEAEFSRFTAAGVPFSRTPGMAYEYSNYGYALAGRAVSNAAGRNYADYIESAFLAPLGMASTGYDLAKVPAGRLAVGYRWEDGRWVEEPALGPGAFGAMGGLMTTASDYAKYIAWELAAWPPATGRGRHPTAKQHPRDRAAADLRGRPAPGRSGRLRPGGQLRHGQPSRSTTACWASTSATRAACRAMAPTC